MGSACRYSGHYSAQGNLRGCKNCIPWESAIGYRFLKWKKGCRGAVWWAAMREKGARRRRNARVQESGQKQGLLQAALGGEGWIKAEFVCKKTG